MENSLFDTGRFGGILFKSDIIFQIIMLSVKPVFQTACLASETKELVKYHSASWYKAD